MPDPRGARPAVREPTQTRRGSDFARGDYPRETAATAARGAGLGTATLPAREAGAAAQASPQRGLPGWAALLVFLGICAIGVIIDEIDHSTARTGFNIAIVIAGIVAILLVRRSAMFPIVVAPPIVYCVVSGTLLYIHSHGLHDHAALFDAGVNWLVYGFPAIAGATAGVLIIGGLRLLTRR